MYNFASQDAQPAVLVTLILYIPSSDGPTLLIVRVWHPEGSNFISWRNDGSMGTSFRNLKQLY